MPLNNMFKRRWFYNLGPNKYQKSIGFIHRVQKSVKKGIGFIDRVQTSINKALVL